MEPEQLEQAYAVIKGQLAIANAERDKYKVRPRAAAAARSAAAPLPLLVWCAGRRLARNARAHARMCARACGAGARAPLFGPCLPAAHARAPRGFRRRHPRRC